MDVVPLDGNPLYDLWRTLHGQGGNRLGSMQRALAPGRLEGDAERVDVEALPDELACLIKATVLNEIAAAPFETPTWLANEYVRKTARFWSARRWSWAVPHPANIARLVSLGPLVEVFAGTGYWAAQIAAAGGDIIATDLQHRGESGRHWWFDGGPYHPLIRQGAVKAAAEYPDRVLFMCWPPLTDADDDAIKAYKGDTIAVVGEHNGVTGSDRAGRRLERQWDSRSYAIPQWDGLHDLLTIWRRR